MKILAAATVCLACVAPAVLGQGMQPCVAIHDSELTRALESMPAVAPTPSGPGTTGNQWWTTNWHYFVMPESMKEALRSDGTAFTVVGDSNITAGALLVNGQPRYPIMISLAAEAIRDDEIAQLTNYVAAGGFLFVGSSSFTRNTNGTTRGDFAFPNELGVHMSVPGVTNWASNSTFTKQIDHRLDNHIPTNTSYALAFKGEDGASGETRSMLTVNAKVKRMHPVMLDSFRFLRAIAGNTPKLCLPSPTWIHMRGGRKTVSESIYPDIEEFWNDIINAYHEEIHDLEAAGCTYLQLDEISFAFLCDATIRERIRADGLDPDVVTRDYARVVDAIAAGAPPSMIVTVHTCRGNFQSMWMAEGGYDRVASIVFGVLIVLYPGVGALSVIWIVGAYAFLFGILLVVLSFRVKALD
jgi:hypothetical protein